MLTLKTITEQRNEVISRLSVKRFDAIEYINRVIEFDITRRQTQTELDANLAEINNISKQIGTLMKAGKKEEAEAVKTKVSELKEISKKLDETKADSEKKIHELLILIPNLPHSSVPEGHGADDNVCEKMGGIIPALPKDALPHWELAKKYNLIDF